MWIPFPISLQTSSSNFVNQKFNDSAAVMLTMFVSRLWILSRSTSNAASSFAACLFNLAFCHCAKILKDHFVTYRVDFGMDVSNSAFSSSAVFNSLNFLLGGIFNKPPSTDSADKVPLSLIC